jgi:hypothetical protein
MEAGTSPGGLGGIGGMFQLVAYKNAYIPYAYGVKHPTYPPLPTCCAAGRVRQKRGGIALAGAGTAGE